MWEIKRDYRFLHGFRSMCSILELCTKMEKTDCRSTCIKRNAKVGDSDWGEENSRKHPRQDVNDSNLDSNKIKIQDSG